MKAIIAIVIVLVLGVVGFCSRGCGENYSEGDRAGTITKFSKKGVAIKSWEGEMVLGGVRATMSADGKSGVAANVWSFSVTDEDVAKKVEEAMLNGSPVVAHYKQWWMSPVAIDSGYVVKGVEIQGATKTEAAVKPKNAATP